MLFIGVRSNVITCEKSRLGKQDQLIPETCIKRTPVKEGHLFSVRACTCACVCVFLYVNEKIKCENNYVLILNS